jgi:hypothetical protein
MVQSSETENNQGKEYLEALQNFGEHVIASKDEMLNIINNGGKYENRFSIKIEVNGKSTIIELHADAYSRLMTMIEDEIREFIELDEVHNNG